MEPRKPRRIWDFAHGTVTRATERGFPVLIGKRNGIRRVRWLGLEGLNWRTRPLFAGGHDSRQSVIRLALIITDQGQKPISHGPDAACEDGIPSDIATLDRRNQIADNPFDLCQRQPNDIGRRGVR